MKRFIILCGIFLFGLSLLAQVVKVEETDLLTVGHRLKTTDIMIEGVTVETPMPEVLKILNMKKSDYEKLTGSGFKLTVSPEWEIWTEDKQYISRIMIRSSYKGLQGKTRELLNIQDPQSFREILFDTYGKADKFEDASLTGSFKITTNKYFYKEGIEICFSLTPYSKEGETWSTISIYSPKQFAEETKDLGPPPWVPYKPTETDGPAFRKAYWGMTQQQVIDSEGTQPEYKKDHMLMFKDSLLNFPVYAVYLFDNGKFYAGKYGFIQKHTNKNDFIDDYEKIKAALIKKYGMPKDDDKFWKNKLYKDDLSQWGFAITLGHLEISTSWETIKANILLQLTGDNYDILFVLQYHDPNYHKSEASEEKDLEKL